MRDQARIDAKKRLPLVPLLVAWIPYAFLVRRFWFVTDDAYITFRYAKNFAAGHGPRYNLADTPPVEGYSNFLWMVVCSMLEFLGLPPELWACILSFATGSLLILLVYRTLVTDVGLDVLPSTIAVVVLAWSPPLAVYSSSGMETLPFTLLLFLTFTQLFYRNNPWGAGSAALALALVRVEGIFWVGFLFALRVLVSYLTDRRISWGLFKAGLLGGGGYLLYWIWRFNYYGLPLPNTAYAKVGASLDNVVRGCKYVLQNAFTFGGPLLVFFASFLVWKKGRWSVVLPACGVYWAVHAYCILVGGDFMAMGRFLLPGAPFGALIVGWCFPDLRRGRVCVGVLAGGLVLLGLLPAWDHSVFPSSLQARFDFRHTGDSGRPKPFLTEYRKWELQKNNALEWAVIGRALKYWIPPGSSIVRHTIGAVGYYSDLHVYDGHGLVIGDAIDFKKDRPVRPGHDVAIPYQHFLRFEPDVLKAYVASGLPGLDTRGEDAARKQFVVRFKERWVDGLREEGLALRYVAALYPVPAWEYGGANRFLVCWRRIRDGESPEEEWRELAARLDAFAMGNLEHSFENDPRQN